MRRSYHHFTQCEEYAAGPDGGMWRIVSGPMRAKHIAESADLMRDFGKFLAAMHRALNEWPNSAAMNLATPGKNRRAWIGHAGCYLATGSPEECTRMGWHTLTPPEQRKANLAADVAIATWKQRLIADLQGSFKDMRDA